MTPETIITIITPILTSSIVTVVVTGGMNYYTKLKTIKESGLYSRRADVIDGFMKHMADVDEAIGRTIQPFRGTSYSEEDEVQQRKRPVKYLSNFFVFFEKHKHYIRRDIADKLNNLYFRYKRILHDYVWTVNPPKNLGEINLNKWDEIWRSYRDDLSKERDEIADDFRKMIGVK